MREKQCRRKTNLMGSYILKIKAIRDHMNQARRLLTQCLQNIFHPLVHLVQLYRVDNLFSDKIDQERLKIHVPIECPVEHSMTASIYIRNRSIVIKPSYTWIQGAIVARCEEFSIQIRK